MAAAVYLASPAPAMITGTHLIVNGGGRRSKWPS